jgi:putative hydrolase of the HAD superfamily
LFDLGGVLIRVSGIPTMMEWTGLPSEQFWERWLASPTVRRFEAGQLSAELFASQLVSEFDLPVDASDFLNQFTNWLAGPYPGAAELLKALTPHYRLASLSNTNALHWERMVNNMDLLEGFDFNFPSHQTGLLKPDKQAFNYVCEALDTKPEKILFLDDNQVNVDAAASFGIVSYRVQGVEGAQKILANLGMDHQG